MAKISDVCPVLGCSEAITYDSKDAPGKGIRCGKNHDLVIAACPTTHCGTGRLVIPATASVGEVFNHAVCVRDLAVVSMSPPVLRFHH